VELEQIHASLFFSNDSFEAIGLYTIMSCLSLSCQGKITRSLDNMQRGGRIVCSSSVSATIPFARKQEIAETGF